MIKLHSYCTAFALILALGACQPGVATYTTAESPHHLALSNAHERIAVRFDRGSARLARGQAQRLRRLAVLGMILPEDRVLVAASGPPHLAAARTAAISRVLLPSRIVVHATKYPWIARNQAILTVDRVLVTLPRCPNWSGPTPQRFNNERTSNLGCATTTDLGLMVASPSDLAGGQALGPADAQPAALATGLYLKNKVPASGGTAAGGAAIAPSAGAGASAGG